MMKNFMLKKRLLTLLIVLISVTILMPGAAFASAGGAESGGQAPRFVDEAGVLTEQESAALEKRLDEVSESFGFDTVIFVVDSLGGWGARELAAEMYEAYDFGMDSQNSGAMLLLSMEDRDYGFATTGRGIDIFTPSKQSSLADRFLPYFKENDYFGGFMAFADGVDAYIVEHDTGLPADSTGAAKNRNPAPAIILSLAIALIFALIVVGVLKRQLKSVRPQNYATEYVRPGSMIVTNSIDRFRYRNVTMTEKSKDNDSGGSFKSSSGTSYSGHSGKF